MRMGEYSYVLRILKRSQKQLESFIFTLLACATQLGCLVLDKFHDREVQGRWETTV